MARSVNNLRNAILCDDIREEVGNKLSLMGIFGGDILVGEFPAQIQLAIFMQYLPSADEEDGPCTIEVELFQDDSRMVRGKIEANITNRQPANILLPKAMGFFEKECIFKVVVSIEGETKEVLVKRLSKTDILKSNRA